MKLRAKRTTIELEEKDEIDILAGGVRVKVELSSDGEVKVSTSADYPHTNTLKIIPDTEEITRTKVSHWFTTEKR